MSQSCEISYAEFSYIYQKVKPCIVRYRHLSSSIITYHHLLLPIVVTIGWSKPQKCHFLVWKNDSFLAQLFDDLATVREPSHQQMLSKNYIYASHFSSTLFLIVWDWKSYARKILKSDWSINPILLQTILLWVFFHWNNRCNNLKGS